MTERCMDCSGVPVASAEHPANEGLDFNIGRRVSREVLCNYLSRSMILADLTGSGNLADDVRMIRNTGAKYIARAGGSWVLTPEYVGSLSRRKEIAGAVHAVDEELILEACIFETVSGSVDMIEIPAWVFTAFDRKVRRRCFSSKHMVFRFGKRRDVFGPGISVPDIRRAETKMLFYYLACIHIDAGFEGLHLGQVHLMGANDWGGRRHLADLLARIRSYAREHARRGTVLINAHTFGIARPPGYLLFDFHASPVRGRAPEGSRPHPSSESEPQDIVPGVGVGKEVRKLDFRDSIITHSLGGIAPSGWGTDSLPYIVELDNWNGFTPELLDKPSFGDDINWWGFDEISWFANQPKAYRARWLAETYAWVRATDPAGHLEMPGRRTAALRHTDGSIRQETYSASDNGGFGDEGAIRKVWTDDRALRRRAGT
ncbi:MAG: hypothetical protein SA339_06780 [Methanomassiliicoccus sp.]|nr:hypothetical protein [Methanomassiliicoccus sp.]